MARKRGSRNLGFWFRKGRGWYVGSDKLLNADGQHIKEAADRQAAEQAYHALRANGPAPESNGNGFTVREVCREYLKEAKAKASPQTYTLRKRLLYDFCEGKKGIHKGYGNLPIADLIGLHVKQWLDAHKWNGSRRMAYQAVRRAFHYGKELGMVPESKTLSFKAGSVRKRKAYFDKAIEETIYATANRALADVIRALINTGCRPGELAQLEKRHIEDNNGRMVWRFAPTEHKTGSKTGRDRVVRVPSEIATLVKHRIKWQSGKRTFGVGVDVKMNAPAARTAAHFHVRQGASGFLDLGQLLIVNTHALGVVGDGIEVKPEMARTAGFPIPTRHADTFGVQVEWEGKRVVIECWVVGGILRNANVPPLVDPIGPR